jgi:hypothetical protein
MKLILVFIELVVVSLFSLFMYWILAVRRATFGLNDVLDVVTNTKANDSDFTWTNESANTLYIHMTIYVVIFVVILPHILIIAVVFDFISANRLTALIFALKLTSFCLFFGGWVDISKLDLKKQDSKFSTHQYFSRLSMAVFVLYIVITGVKIAGHLSGRIFRIRVSRVLTIN